MTVEQVIEELPRLSYQDRRVLCRKIIEIESEEEDIAMCEENARQGFAMLDEMEAEDARNA